MFGSADLQVKWFRVAIRAIELVVGLAGIFWIRYGKSLVQRASGIRGRDWPTISALVDIVTVVPQSGPLVPESGQARRGECADGYLATLTYFYRNPDLQTGDYCRVFDSEGEARAWATSFKGRTVLVHVDPRNPSRSVLRTEEL